MRNCVVCNAFKLLIQTMELRVFAEYQRIDLKKVVLLNAQNVGVEVVVARINQ